MDSEGRGCHDRTSAISFLTSSDISVNFKILVLCMYPGNTPILLTMKYYAVKQYENDNVKLSDFQERKYFKNFHCILSWCIEVSHTVEGRNVIKKPNVFKLIQLSTFQSH